MVSDCHEEDYRRVVGDVGPTRTLPHTAVEIVRPRVSAQPPRHVLFDFDGTLSLIREGWPEVMIPLMVEIAPGHRHGRIAGRAAAAVHRFRHGPDRQADDLPDDPAGRGDRPPRRPARGPAGLQAAVSRPADGADRRPARGAALRADPARGNARARLAGTARRLAAARRGAVRGQRHRRAVRDRGGRPVGPGPLLRAATSTAPGTTTARSPRPR